MIQTVCRIAFSFAVLFSLSLASARAQQPEKSRFDRWDKNGDSQLSKDELPEALRKNFDRIDRDGNGSISREEDAACPCPTYLTSPSFQDLR